MRIQPYERQLGIAPRPQVQAQPNYPTGDFGQGAAQTVGTIAARLQQINNDLDDARTLELFNQYKAESQSYHEDPDKGIYNTRLGYQSKGVFLDADRWLRSRGEEYASKLTDNRAKENFRRMAREHIQQMGAANSRFEAEQVRRYQAEQADAAIKNGLDEAGRNAYDDEAIERVRQSMTDALELKFRHSSPEKQREALTAMESDIAAARLNVMLHDMPLEAETWFNEHKDSFTPDSQIKYAEAIKSATETFKIQTAVDQLVKTFPQGNEQQALKWIRENFSGDMEERVASAFKTRANEIALDLNRDNRLKKLQQEELRDKIITQFNLYGTLPPDAQLKEWLADDKLSNEHYEDIKRRANTLVNRTRIEQEILTANPGISLLELDNLVMRRLGVTQQEYQRTFAAAAQAVMSGQMGSNELDDLFQRGKLPRNDVERFKKRAKDLDDIQKSYYRSEQQRLNDTIKALVAAGLPEELAQGIRDQFAAGETLYEPRDKDYRQKLQELRTRVLVDAIDKNEDLKTGWFGITSKLGEMYKNIQNEKLETRGIDPFPTLPSIEPSPLNLDTVSSTNRQGAASSSRSPVFDMVQGATVPKGGGFDAPRAYRNGTHNGLDLAGKKGSKIVMRDFLTPLTVSNVNTATPTKGAGNSVTLKGTYPRGDTIEMTLGHMQNHSINVDVGQVVAPGTLIGLVGNTGMTSENGNITPWREDKKTGYHLDVKIKINGKYVDPATFDPSKYMISNTKSKPEDIFFIPNYEDI